MFKNKNESNRISTLKNLLKLDDQEFLDKTLELNMTYDDEDMEIMTKRFEVAEDIKSYKDQYDKM